MYKGPLWKEQVLCGAGKQCTEEGDLRTNWQELAELGETAELSGVIAANKGDKKERIKSLITY